MYLLHGLVLGSALVANVAFWSLFAVAAAATAAGSVVGEPDLHHQFVGEPLEH
jgi:hypothetical protein